MRSVWASLLMLVAIEGMAVQTLDTVVVTGTRTERLSRESPVRTEVVSRDDIEVNHARDLKEALQYVPGLQLREIHGKSGSEVWMQGLNADRVLILVDGMPVSPTTGSSVDVTQLSLLDVERVEVVKGATSALYGSAAMGGVVNIITRRIPRGVALQGVIDGGTYGEQNPDGDERFGTQHGRLQASAGGERWRGRLALDENASEGIDPDPSSWAQPGDEFKRRSGEGRLEWHGNDERSLVYAQVSRFEEDTESRTQSDLNADNLPDRLTKVGELSRERRSGGVHWRSEAGVRWTLDGVSEDMREATVKQVEGLQFDFRDAEYGVSRYSTRVELPFIGQHQWLFGFDYTPENLNQYKDGASELQCGVDCEDAERDAYELYLQDAWKLHPDWEMLLGARYQNDSDFGDHVSPKFNVRYQWLQRADLDVFVRTGVGSGFRVPNLKERYYVFDHSSLGYMLLGNPALEPESSVSWQAGLGFLWRQNLSVDFNLYYNDLDDLIQTDFDSLESGIVYYRYLNIDRARTWGAELTTRVWLHDSVQFNGGYTWLRSEDKATGEELTRRPRHQITAAIDWIPAQYDWMASLRWRAQSDELVSTDTGVRSPGWGVLDLKLNVDVTDQLRVFSGIDNLFDRQRDFTRAGEDFAPIAGRYPYVGIRVALGS